MTDLHPEIRAVLDRSAIQSYAQGHVHVGEVITEIAGERAYVGIPATALLDAHARCGDDKVARARLDVLVHLPGARTLDLTAETAGRVAGTVAFTGGDLARSHAIWAALEHSAAYLTAEPQESTRLVADDRIIIVPAGDA
ncbi:hypothetical protein [Couchioplanes caeruleus]|uniref:Uncharacterized protein n=2 Tax=Couchioplanes caeruleus TaxID=56438 RepID=A0A1K0GMW8_9ACTN|nr:hypothetical protein [Couchioplanes caeruleus]OJF13702.1 hypothetical protein BG844_13620 [Couchioplanes caeruleus subsp. caeruleus]ROP32484.1 hypothetical protein EDD30_5427 [Couchioplanes caeruleus]